MTDLTTPKYVPNFIDGREVDAAGGERFTKLAPATGRALAEVARSRAADVKAAVETANRAQPAWAGATVVERGDILREIALGLRSQQDDVACLVAEETGKSRKDARGETGAAIEMGMFVAGEGRRFYGRTTTSAVPNKAALTVRQPLGVAGLIIAANTPIANVAWKVFPALLCGNSAILKPSEDTPLSAWGFARIARDAGLPNGVLNVIHGFGEEAGAPLVESAGVDIVSFTGSCKVGRYVARVAGERLAKVCLELGGKNPLIVCDDAALDRAAEAACLSAYSNAGQRCASGSRIIVFDGVYEKFREMLLARTRKLRIGTGDEDDLGPVINQTQLTNMCAAVEAARAEGVTVLIGGGRLAGPGYEEGFFMEPTLLENAGPAAEISRTEVFGPITCLYRVKDFDEAIALANDSPFGLTASIHTANVHRAMAFLSQVRSGVATVNGGTYGSEPHMPFGGLRDSGNGLREAGTEALDVYSDLKTIYINFDPTSV